MGSNPFVHAFVSAANEEETGPPCQFSGHVVGQKSSLGTEEYHPRGRLRAVCEGLNGPKDGLRLHHHPSTAAIGCVIRHPVLVAGKPPEVLDSDR